MGPRYRFLVPGARPDAPVADATSRHLLGRSSMYRAAIVLGIWTYSAARLRGLRAWRTSSEPAP
jgi:hypothetical protein